MTESVMVMDVGNSNTKIGVYQGTRLYGHWRLATSITWTADELGMAVRALLREAGLGVQSVTGVVICSVVPPLMPVLERMCRSYLQLNPLVVGPGIKTGLDIKAENPREVGADRIVNSVAALRFYPAPIIVVDFGTATTFCVLDDAGHYVGGAIGPGVHGASEALFQTAAKLPRVELAKPRHVIGKSTVASVQSGLVYGFAGLVDGLVDRMTHELPQAYTVVATGGFSELIGPETKVIQHVHPLLTLEGLRIVWERNRER